MRKKIFIGIVLLLVVIQFIRPARNVSQGTTANDISKAYTVPPAVDSIMQRSCNDCHSNNTHYPWYANIQPVGWWLQMHVNDGKEELNFSTFLDYTPKLQHGLLKQSARLVQKNRMPLDNYTWMHKDAVLSDEDKKVFMAWADTLAANIALAHHLPPSREDDH